MTMNLDELIPSANEVMRKMALAEAEKAAEAFRKHADSVTAASLLCAGYDFTVCSSSAFR